MSVEAYDYGKQDGAAEERQRIIDLLEKEDSVCSAWAVALIKEKSNEQQ